MDLEICRKILEKFWFFRIQFSELLLFFVVFKTISILAQFLQKDDLKMPDCFQLYLNFDKIHLIQNSSWFCSDFRCIKFGCNNNKFLMNISFSSSNTQFYESRILWLFTFWVFFPDRGFKLISKYTQKCQYNSLYKMKKTLCNTLNWGSWN